MEEQKYSLSLAGEWSMRAGLFAGGIWIASFLCYMYGTTGREFLATLAMPLGLLSLFVVGGMLGRFKATVQEVTAGRTFITILRTYFNATLLTALAQYGYFRYLDHGRFANAIEKAFDMPEMAAFTKQIPKEALDQMLAILVKPIDATTYMFTYDIIIGLILSGPTLLYAIYVAKRIKQNKNRF